METDKKFSEMLHGDTAWMKYQSLMNRETVQRAIRSGKSVLMLDAEYGSRVLSLEADPWEYLQKVLSGGMGFGKGMNAKREMVTRVKVIRTIDAGSPALAAEQRCTDKRSEQFAEALIEMRQRNMEAARRYRHLNWGYYWGRGQASL